MRKQTRREMLKTAAVAGVGYHAICAAGPARAESANDKLNVAVIGIGGQGRSNLNGVAKLEQNIVALCDVDEKRAGNAFERFPDAEKFTDFRVMFDKLEKQIDAVVVSTPDHTHFHPSMLAMSLGKHLYCEKPMAHCVAEVRAMTELAAEKKVATQLGVQRHTIDNVHRVVELIQGGAIGSVHEVHSWVGGNRGMPDPPTKAEDVPENLDWDLWLGPAKFRPYSSAYAPYKWRFWWDFGTGETGNWGCHILDIPFWALKLKYPTQAECNEGEPHPQTTPRSMATSFQFPERDGLPPVKLHWYHTKEGPPVLKEHGLPKFGGGTLFIGSEGMLLCDFGKRMLFPKEKFADFKAPDKSIPDSPGFHKEWVDACKGGDPATCNFDYSGPLTETVLLGNVAYRAQASFDWNAETLTPSVEAVTPFLLDEYREGWEFKA